MVERIIDAVGSILFAMAVGRHYEDTFSGTGQFLVITSIGKVIQSMSVGIESFLILLGQIGDLDEPVGLAHGLVIMHGMGGSVEMIGIIINTFFIPVGIGTIFSSETCPVDDRYDPGKGCFAHKDDRSQTAVKLRCRSSSVRQEKIRS